ncbi:hypothetical protein B0H17DRAFT_1093809, partial [Mycena rosella]
RAGSATSSFSSGSRFHEELGGKTETEAGERMSAYTLEAATPTTAYTLEAVTPTTASSHASYGTDSTAPASPYAYPLPLHAGWADSAYPASPTAAAHVHTHGGDAEHAHGRTTRRRSGPPRPTRIRCRWICSLRGRRDGLARLCDPTPMHPPSPPSRRRPLPDEMSRRRRPTLDGRPLLTHALLTHVLLLLTHPITHPRPDAALTPSHARIALTYCIDSSPLFLSLFYLCCFLDG